MTPAPLPASPTTEITLEGTLDRVVYVHEESGWSVVRLEVPGRAEAVTVVGNLLEVQPGEFLKLSGGWENDRKFGQQFRVRSFVSVLPASVTAIERYLGSGLIRGIGKVMARRMVETFGEKTLEVIDRYSARLTEVEGIGPKRSAMIREAWVEQREIKEVMLFLAAHQVATSHALRIWKTYGSEAISVVRANPYRLAVDIYGIGFKTADQIAANLGIPADSPERARAALAHLLGESSGSGHLYLPRQRLVNLAVELLSVDASRVEEALDRLEQAGEVVLETGTGDEGPAIYSKALHLAETDLASGILELAAKAALPLDIDVERALAWFEQREGLELAPEQRSAIRRALVAKVLVITGGPGTGKTTLVRGIVTLLAKKKRRVLLAAPTGRAAKRLAEATGMPAKTVHRLLEFNPRTASFERGPSHPLEADLLLVDESSMLDTPLAQVLVRALPAAAQLVLVGDVDQLPSVGPGNVLADLIRSGVAEVVRLTQIFRQAEKSAIVVNAHRIQRGEMPDLSGGEDADFFFIERTEPEAVLEAMRQVISVRIPQRFGLDPKADVQVLTPMNRGILGVANLNQALRELLNPKGREVVKGGKLLRVGDKVMQTRNNYDLEVFNGDLGTIAAIDAEENRLEVSFEGRRVDYEFSDLDELTPAYACTIHKSQGSEYPVVVLPVHTQHYVMLERNLIYTALTRAKRLAVLIGQKRALGIAINNTKTERRFTLLAERLAGRLG